MPLANSPRAAAWDWLNTALGITRDLNGVQTTGCRCPALRQAVDASTHAYCHNAASTRPVIPRARKQFSRRAARKKNNSNTSTMADPKANPLTFSGNAADMLKQYGQAVPDRA